LILLKAWISAFRLRTLPLSISGILVGLALAKIKGQWDFGLFLGAISTTLLFQITSNLANDLGDTLKGTDNKDRVGPIRSVQSGAISKKIMTYAIILFSILSIISSGLLIYHCSISLSKQALIIYMALAVLCLIAAITYTIGKKAYGYHGLGDLMVFIFFGLVSVMGSYGLLGLNINVLTLLASISIGLWSVGVLNLNNMRDQENDKQSNKITLAVRFGFLGAKKYHFVLMLTGIVTWILLISMISYSKNKALYFFCLLPILIVVFHLNKVAKMKHPKEFDPELKRIALATFFASLLLFIVSYLLS